MEWASQDETAGTDKLFINLPQSGLSMNKIKEPTRFFPTFPLWEEKQSFFSQIN